MKIHFLPLIALTALALPTGAAPGRTPGQSERIEAAFLLGLGRTASPAEVEASADATAVADLLANIEADLKSDSQLAAQVATRAWRDTFGSEPANLAGSAGAASEGTYFTQMQAHLRRIAANQAERRAVIERAYRQVVQRAPYDIEQDYWAAREPMPFFLLCACIENWAVRNQPGLMSTTGTPSIAINSGQLTTSRLSPAVADEVRAVLGRPLRAADALGVSRGQLVLAPGGASIESIGGIHLVAAGRAD